MSLHLYWLVLSQLSRPSPLLEVGVVSLGLGRPIRLPRPLVLPQRAVSWGSLNRTLLSLGEGQVPPWDNLEAEEWRGDLDIRSSKCKGVLGGHKFSSSSNNSSSHSSSRDFKVGGSCNKDSLCHNSSNNHSNNRNSGVVCRNNRLSNSKGLVCSNLRRNGGEVPSRCKEAEGCSNSGGHSRWQPPSRGHSLPPSRDLEVGQGSSSSSNHSKDRVLAECNHNNKCPISSLGGSYQQISSLECKLSSYSSSSSSSNNNSNNSHKSRQTSLTGVV